MQEKHTTERQREGEDESKQGIIVPLDLPEFEIVSQCLQADGSIEVQVRARKVGSSSFEVISFLSREGVTERRNPTLERDGAHWSCFFFQRWVPLCLYAEHFLKDL
jgi:hypothetical protein